MSKQASFVGQPDAPLKKKMSFGVNHQSPVFDATKNFVPASAPAKLNIEKGNVFAESLPMLDLTKCQKNALLDQPATPATRCNTNSHASSSQGSYPNSDLEEVAFDQFLESPNKRLVKQESIRYKKQCTHADVEPCTPLRSSKTSKQENAWKRKVKTELCRFWLSGLQCENQLKEQGCGFAHG